MTEDEKKRNKRHDQELERLALRWRDRLWLNQWRVKTRLVDRIIDKETGTDAEDTAAVTKHNVDYRELDIGILRRAWRNYSRERKNQVVAHEMVHGLLGSLREFIFRLLESPPKNNAQVDVYFEWFHAVDELLTTHVTDVLLDAAKELKGVQKK